MPYIDPDRRYDLVENKGNKMIIAIDRLDMCGGDIQYILAELIDAYLKLKGLNYQHCQDIMGALAGAQMEFYRCVVGPYEQEKIAQNGPVYQDWRQYPTPKQIEEDEESDY